MNLNDLARQHHDAIKATLSQPARFPDWIIESALLSVFAEAGRSGFVPDREAILGAVVRRALKLRVLQSLGD